MDSLIRIRTGHRADTPFVEGVDGDVRITQSLPRATVFLASAGIIREPSHSLIGRLLPSTDADRKSLRSAIRSGTYTVKTNYAGGRRQKPAGDAALQVEWPAQVDSGNGKPGAIARRLENEKDLIDAGTFVVGTT